MQGEGAYASAGGVWMGGGGPVSDGNYVYVTTGNGPWDPSQQAYGDSVLKFTQSLQLEDYFTPFVYAYMDCADADLAAGGLLLIPGTTELLAGGKTGKLYLVNSDNLGQEQNNDTGATQTPWFEDDLIAPYENTCTNTIGGSAEINSYEIFGSAAYFNGSVYLGITPTASERYRFCPPVPLFRNSLPRLVHATQYSGEQLRNYAVHFREQQIKRHSLDDRSRTAAADWQYAN